MTAAEARALAGTKAQLEKYIPVIDAEIEKRARRGLRTLEVHQISGIYYTYFTDLQVHYSSLGFEVHHYVSPHEELVLKW